MSTNANTTLPVRQQRVAATRAVLLLSDGATLRQVRGMATTVGDNIRHLRERVLRISQRELDKRAGTSGAVGMIESGARGQAPRPGTLEKIARALGVTVEDLRREHSREAGAVLRQFLAGTAVTEQERELLIWMTIPGREHTAQSYALLLATIRATDPKR